MTEKKHSQTGMEIAIIGMSGRFPGANNIQEFWENLKNGVESISFFTNEELRQSGFQADLLENPNYVKARGILANAEYFDASFFGYSHVDARVMDPQIRIFHECVLEALEHAGYDPYSYKGLIGLFAGASSNLYWQALTTSLSGRDSAGSFNTDLLNDKDFLTTRISYVLNLNGPSVVIQTACSTSLVAVHVACRLLLTRGCNIALAGGVSVSMPQKRGHLYQEGMIMSSDGHCRTFDAEASGTVGGEGAGVVVLKRLEDAKKDGDTIWAVIKGSEINNDGFEKVGYTAPSIGGQSKIVKKTHYMAGVDPETIGYIEAHGTGTALGDPIEIEALKKAFNTLKRNYCAVGSVKTNIGHLNEAAGIAGLIKTVLALQHKLIPPSLHYKTPNPRIDFTSSPFYVNTRLQDWNANMHPRRAGVSSFGIGGTNAHVILEEAPEIADDKTGRPYQLLLISAKTETALDRATIHLRNYIEKNPGINLADAAYTLQVGRRSFDYRRMLVSKGYKNALELLADDNLPRLTVSEQRDQTRSTAFMFSGVGDHYVQMAKELYQWEPIFHQTIDRCCEWLRPLLNLDLRDILYPTEMNQAVPPQEWDFRQMLGRSETPLSAADMRLNRVELAQPAVFVIEYALVELLKTWGVVPDVLIGYSLGEYVAACVAGVFSLQDALTIVARRAQLIQLLPEGAMLFVSLSESRVHAFLNESIQLAVVNDPEHCVLSGSRPALIQLEKQLTEKSISCRKIETTHALHSKMMEPIKAELTGLVQAIQLHKPQIPYLSNVTGDWITGEEATNPAYWARHLCETVRFTDGLEKLLSEPEGILVEIGPGQSLSSFARQHPACTQKQLMRILPTMRHAYDRQPDLLFLLGALGKLWLAGIQMNWLGFYNRERRRRIPLPTYPFERHHYWIEKNLSAMFDERLMPVPRIQSASIKKTAMENWFYLPSWERVELITAQTKRDNRRCLLFVNDNRLAVRLSERLQGELHDPVIVTIGAKFNKQKNNHYCINPREKNGYHFLFNDLYAQARFPELIIHLWTMSDTIPSPFDPESVRRSQDAGFYSLLYLTRAIGEHNISQDIEIITVSNNLHEVTGEEIIDPWKAMLLGPCKVIPQEYGNIRCRSIDLWLTESEIDREAELSENLAAEFLAQCDEPVIAYRNNRRWVQVFKIIQPGAWNKILNKADSGALPWRKNGVYLITGGLDEMGLFFAECLAKTVKAKLILLSHSEFPLKEAWEEWIQSYASDDPIRRRIIKIKEIEAAGSEVLVYRVDFSEFKEVEKIVNAAEKKLGAIRGIIHAAGANKPDFISEINKEAYESYFQEKTYGLLNLAEVFRDRDLDFCALMSSLSSILGGLGFAAYAAANIFMDSFVLNFGRSRKWISINWDGWNFNEEKSKDGSAGKESIDLAIGPLEGWEAFRRILNLPHINQIIVSTGSLEDRFKKWIKLETAKKLDDLQNDHIRLRFERPNLSTSYTAPQDETEKRLTIIWQEFFGLENIGSEDSFFELGGNSLKVITLAAKIHKEFEVKVWVRDIFQRPTIRELAKRIKSMEPSPYSSIQPVEKKEFYPVSSAQKRMYVLKMIEDDGTSYNIPGAIIIEGNLDQQRLEDAFRLLLERHEGLRTSFDAINGEPAQKIHDHVDFNIQRLKTDEEKAKNLAKEFIKPFDLSKTPLLRVLLLKIASKRHILLYDMPHIISDGTSTNLLMKEFAALYNQETLPALRIQYKDFSIWQNNFFKTDILKKQREYWLNVFTGEIPVLDLPTDYPRPSMQNFEGDRLSLGTDAVLTERLNQLAAKTGSTLYMVLLSAYNILLSKYTGQEDIIVGSPIAGRPHIDLQNIIGIFTNTLAMRNFPKGNKSYREFLNEVKENSLKAYENQDYPFEELVGQMNLPRNLSRNPLFDTMFLLHNIDVEEIVLSDLKLLPYEFERKTTIFDITLMSMETSEGIRITLEYCTKLYKKETMAKFAMHFLKLLREIATGPEKKLADLEMLTENERGRILIEFNRTQADYPQNKTIYELFESQADQTPEAVALVY
ncbi:MAG: SDR family NAD(P)-dependent oxidoreductase, partial [Desulfobacteraceae bacterium]